MIKLAIGFFILGAISLFIQNTFYGDVDVNGILQDSIFLPIGSISIIISILFFVLSGIFYISKKFKK